MKTEAAKSLPPAQKSVLNWIVDGRAPANSWMSSFEDAVEAEIAEKAQKKSEKGTVAPIPDADPDAGAEA